MPVEIPEKTYFKIGEVARIVDVKPYIIRYWESEFSGLRPAKTKSRQRLFRRRDIELLLAIKRLLYEHKFTIEGARQRLRDMAQAGLTIPGVLAELDEGRLPAASPQLPAQVAVGQGGLFSDDEEDIDSSASMSEGEEEEAGATVPSQVALPLDATSETGPIRVVAHGGSRTPAMPRATAIAAHSARAPAPVVAAGKTTVIALDDAVTPEPRQHETLPTTPRYEVAALAAAAIRSTLVPMLPTSLVASGGATVLDLGAVDPTTELDLVPVPVLAAGALSLAAGGGCAEGNEGQREGTDEGAASASPAMPPEELAGVSPAGGRAGDVDSPGERPVSAGSAELAGLRDQLRVMEAQLRSVVSERDELRGALYAMQRKHHRLLARARAEWENLISALEIRVRS